MTTDAPVRRASDEERLAPYFKVAGAVLGLLLTARVLAAFARIVQPYLAVHYGGWVEIAVVVCQVLFQWAIMARRSWDERIRYAGLLVAGSVFGAVLLLPILLLNLFAPVTIQTAVGCLLGVVTLMFALHWLFVGYMKLPRILCATWVLYRLVLLALLVKHP